MNKARLKKRVRGHEGENLKPYYCTAGKLTIGVGRNLEDVGLSPAESDFLFENDLARCESEAKHSFPHYSSLSDLRQEVVVEMIFHLGLGGVLKFKKMIAAIGNQDYAEAPRQIMDSALAQQTPSRAMDYATAMRDGA